MDEYECNICSNLIIKSVIVFCEIISLLANVWRPVKSTRQTQEAAYRKDVSKRRFLHKVVSQANNAGSHDGKSTQHLAPVGVVDCSLANTEGNKIVDEASTEDPVAACSETGESSTGDGLDGGAWEDVLVVCNTQVVEEVENANTGKGLSVDVCEDGRETLGVHGTKLGEDEVKLGEGVDDDENVGELEIFAVPRKGPRANTDISQNVVGDEVDDLVQFALLLGLAGIKLPQAVQPGELDDLLREEEATDKVRLGRPE